jgi:hypothetical protein
MGKKDRTGYDLEVEFEYDGKKEKVLVDIPFPIFIEAVRDYCMGRSVNMDGTDNAVWNLLIDFDCLDMFEDDKDFIEKCKELYKGSRFEEEDYEEWKDDYEFDHNLGKYAEEE